MGNYPHTKVIKNLILLIEQINKSKIKIDTVVYQLQALFLVLESHNHICTQFSNIDRELSIAQLGLIGLVLHYYQNLFYTQFQQTLPTTI